ncbi:MAG: DUF3857 domain-containing protein [Sphingobacteriales bacterium]|nr:DUF3857 domain-containing protein [Sphingobacteriales bacterium]
MKFKTFIVSTALLSISFAGFTQDKSNVKFVKISAEDFNITSPVIDSSTAAVVVADIGSSEFEGNRKAGFSIRYKRFARIKILTKNGIDAANVQIPLYVDGQAEEKLDNLKAYTYNLENGKVVETKLESESVFKEKVNKKVSVRKFTMPAVKPGSIIEFTYTIVSDFIFNLQPWEFQGEYPRLWSEYRVDIPEYFRYIFLSQGSKDFFIKKDETTRGRWEITFRANSTERSETEKLEGNIQSNRWVMKDLPALKEEAFTSTIDNHTSKIQFQLASIHYPNSPFRPVMSSWDKAMEDLMKDDEFGELLSHPNNWLDDDMKAITDGAATPLEKAKQIFKYIKNNFTATRRSGVYLTDNLKTIFKNKHGNVAEINLLLTAMLLHENIKAFPVLLSTRDHGYTNELYPILEKFNYVICLAQISNNDVLLDASNPSLGFGQLHWKCYNGHCRVVDPKDPSPVYLVADSLKEKKFTLINIANDEKEGWAGTVTNTLGTYESISVKEEVFDKGLDEFFKKVKSDYTMEIKMGNTGIDSLKQDGMPVNIHYDINFNLNKDEDIIYFNPLLSEAYKENPFKSAARKYPVEMPYAFDETIIANIEVPAGYELDELPKSSRVNYNEDEGSFEYLIGKTNDGGIQLRCRIKMNRANFQPEEYESLRDFYAYIVKKQAEPVVFKKKQ